MGKKNRHESTDELTKIQDSIASCQNEFQLAGLLSTQDFTKQHPSYALLWVKQIMLKNFI